MSELVSDLPEVIEIGFVALLTAAAADRFINRGGDEPNVGQELAEMNARLDRLEQALRDRR